MGSIRGPVEYFAHTFFAFVPNVCNAHCSFCYVEPVLAGSAKLSPSVLEYASQVASEMADAGFTQVRFTGGDPLVFSNITDLFDIFVSAGLTYRVLSNGLGLTDNVLSFFRATPPDRVLISLHDADDPGSVLGVDVDVDAFFASLKACAEIAELECTVVVLDPATVQVPDLLEKMRFLGASRAKVVFENSKRSAAHVDAYSGLVSDLKSVGQPLPLRVSSTSTRVCMLRTKGFLSIDLTRRCVYQCCAQVGDLQRSMDWDPGDALTTRLDLAMASALVQSDTGLPCANHYNACPIALEDL